MCFATGKQFNLINRYHIVLQWLEVNYFWCEDAICHILIFLGFIVYLSTTFILPCFLYRCRQQYYHCVNNNERQMENSSCLFIYTSWSTFGPWVPEMSICCYSKSVLGKKAPDVRHGKMESEYQKERSKHKPNIFELEE